MTYQPRTYRRQMQCEDLTYFPVIHRETDLWIGVDVRSFSVDMPGKVHQKVQAWRQELDVYIQTQSVFFSSLRPIHLLPAAPALAHVMSDAASLAGVGPMAAVAGAFAQAVGEFIRDDLHVKEVIVENGGDIFLHLSRDATVGIFAGNSPLSDKLKLLIPSKSMPLGVCTSAGTIGPSLSLGLTDATVTLATSAALADAYATTLGNLVQHPADIKIALARAPLLSGLLGCIIIIEDRMGAWGQIEFT